MSDLISFLSSYGLSFSDFIQAVLSILTFVTSVIAIIISIKSVKLTEKSIYEANRPVVNVYLDYIYVYGGLHEYLVIKNFGKTQAKVIDISFDKKIHVTDDDETPLLEEYGLPFTLAPGQSFSTILRTNAHQYVEDEDKHTFNTPYFKNINVKITYKDSVKTFNESFLLNQDLSKNIRLSKSNGSKNTSPVKAILHATEEILRRDV